MKVARKTGNTRLLVGYVVLMVAIVVAVDIVFFRHHFGERLLANMAIVLLFVLTYFQLLRRN